MTKFNLKEIPLFSDCDRIVVVGVIGKSPFNRQSKSSILNCDLDENEPQVECKWNEKDKILYLHMTSFFDANQLIKLYDTEIGKDKPSSDGVGEARNEGDYMIAMGDVTTDVCRNLLLLFHLCHIIVLYTPGSTFDISYLNLFKAVDSARLEEQSKITELLTPHVNSEWSSHGRLCCPRLLFFFDSCPRPLRNSDLGRLKKLEHSIEDQIYHILRKSRIITNICSKSLFAIPKNEEFVYMRCEGKELRGDLSSAIRNLVLMCQGQFVIPDWYSDPPSSEQRPTFKQFLKTHVDVAFSTGFDDNVGKYATGNQFFEVPSAKQWVEVAKILYHHYIGDTERSWEGLWNVVSIDTKFSQARCAKVLPIAQASYSEGLPSHYSLQHHKQRVAVAVNVFDAMARGPLCSHKRHALEEACETIWKSRRLCEYLSLMGNPCIKPVHSVSEDECHMSGVVYYAACNCGRSNMTREDPYTLKQANYTFYNNTNCNGCKTATVIEIPVFQPSSEQFSEANLSQEKQLWMADEQSESLSGESESTPASGIYINMSSEIVKGLDRQASTTEYLPGMLHMDSPPGLLPVYPSWSLMCIGASSLYSHNLGLPEHLQPGFLPHTNFLLPWDCAVKSVPKLEQSSVWRRRPPLTVKIFLGLEYECVRGHRFMLSSPEESGATVATTDSPLYCHCVCRGSKTRLAQLMRIHIVTPKAPVYVTLDPKVQPVAGGPIFVPGWDKPAKLEASTYWILRLPSAYGAERGVLPLPTLPLANHARGRLLANCIGLSEVDYNHGKKVLNIKM